MRIIAGIFRGKKIIQPKNDKTRPLKDLVKESIFNILHHSNKLNIKLENSIVLDLFAGVGSFGLECLSRNAKLVIFIENYKEALLPSEVNDKTKRYKYGMIFRCVSINDSLNFRPVLYAYSDIVPFLKSVVKMVELVINESSRVLLVKRLLLPVPSNLNLIYLLF